MNKLKVLLVDDEESFLEVMSARIDSWGYEVVTTSKPKEVIKLIRDSKINIVVLDYMMPGMDGVTTLKEIRKIDKKIPVIMFTAYPNTEAMEKIENLNVSSFIPKLSNFSDTQSALKTAIKMVHKKLCETDQ